MVTALVLLDLSKAFDSISHSILLHKLISVGASPRAVQWFKSYLTSRSQFIRTGSTVSSACPIAHGVPQGAILSPLLFSIDLNDLQAVPHRCHLESYVDHTKVFMFFSIKEIDTAKQTQEEDLQRIAKWCLTNQLLVNPDKTKFLLMGIYQLLQRLVTILELNLLGTIIKSSSSTRDLGVS